MSPAESKRWTAKLSRAIFITGTDTGVGKTVICGCLARYFQDKGLRVITQKWVSTGNSGFPQDLSVHLRLMGKTKTEFKRYLPAMAPYSFRLPASPHLAAKAEGKKISPAKIKKSLQGLSRDFDLVIVEGAGGLLVPLTGNLVMAELVSELGLPVLVVAANKLGAINHTLLTIEALRVRRINVLGVIFTNLSRRGGIIRRDNPRIIRKLGKVKILGEVPCLTNFRRVHQALRSIGDSLWTHLP